MNRRFLILVLVLSIAIPGLVAVLIFLPQKTGLDGWVYALPHLHAILNGTTSVLLIAALVAIKTQRIRLHRSLMTVCLILGAIFLISYVTYHSSAESTVYGDVDHNGLLDASEKESAGSQRSVYLFVLLSHIGLSMLVVPLVLISFYFGWTNQIIRHKKLVKFSYPIWLYVSCTGVIVYLLISPYYA